MVDCCSKGCLKMWLLATQLLISIIYIVYFCDLIFRYDVTVGEMTKYFDKNSSVQLGVGVIFFIAIYLVFNTFCGCCVAWQPERCCFLMFVVCTIICLVMVLVLFLYSLIGHDYYPLGVVCYLVLGVLSVFFAFKVKNIKDDPGYMELLEQMINQEAEELYSYSGARSREEELEIKERLGSLHDKNQRKELEKKIQKGGSKKEAGFFDFRRDTVMVIKEMKDEDED